MVLRSRSSWIVAGLSMMLAACSAAQGTRAPASGGSAGGAGGPPPGMNAAGEVIDSSKVEAGHGTTVKGINDWEGEITGKPFPGAKFTKLKIGMPRAEVEKLIGKPTDEGAYVTGKAFIPYYYGSDQSRIELAYKGQGRLIFSTGAGWGSDPGHLTWIIYNKNDTGYR